MPSSDNNKNRFEFFNAEHTVCITAELLPHGGSCTACHLSGVCESGLKTLEFAVRDADMEPHDLCRCHGFGAHFNILKIDGVEP
jgi:hypothetical protein